MKNKYLKKAKSFTLIEILVSVTIFVIVSSLVMVTISTAMRSKSKTLAINNLRAEGGKIMVEIQDMVQKGNGTVEYGPGVVIMPNAACIDIPAGASYTLYSFNTDYKNWRTRRAVSYDNTNKNIIFRKRILDNNNAEIAYHEGTINSNDVKINNFTIGGRFNNYGACNPDVSTIVNVSFEVEAKSPGTTGAPTKVTLESTFTAKFPYPDMGTDSVPAYY